MMYRAIGWIGALGLLLAGALPSPAQEKPLPEEAQKAADAVKAYLQKLKGDHAQLIYNDEPALKKIFPEHVFIVARYRVFPVARILPEGLRPSNVFAVTRKEHHVELVKDVKGLQAFFKANQVPAKDEPTAKASLVAWLTLAQEFPQDGFYKFEVLAKDFGSELNDKTQTVRGRAIVTQGGKGEIGATLVYEGGKLASATESGKIMPGPRPICQATKLLDRDLIVRRMAEQDLLFMGLAAHDYLMEQRQQANPELRDAIDRLWRKIQESGW
jgi:hypothetical protein